MISISRLKKLRHDPGFRELLRNSGTMYIAGIFTIALTFAQQIITANRLGPAEYGRMAAVLSSATLMLLVMDFRTWEAGTKFLARYWANKAYDETASVTTLFMAVDILAGLVGFLLLLLLAQPIATYLLHAPELAWLVRLFALSLPFKVLGMGIPTAVLRLHNRFGWLSAKSIIYAIVRLILISGAAFIGLGLPGAIAGALMGEIINAFILFIMMWVAQKQVRPDKPVFRLHKPQDFREICRMMGSLWIGATLKGLQLETFVPLLALLTSPVQVGLFRSGLDIAQLVLKVVEPISIVIQPNVIKHYEMDSRGTFLRYIKQSTLLLASFTWPFIIGLIIAGPLILPRLLGEDYEGIYPITLAIAIGYMMAATFLWTRPGLVAVNRIREHNIIGIVGFSFSALSLLVLAPTYGALGAAWVMAVFFIGTTILALYVFYRAISPVRYAPNSG
jgi:O-antigen/teichoic acid export membrane protein